MANWLKEANKMGKYEFTHKGFRVYSIIQPSHTERFEERPDGKYMITEFTRGKYVAIDKFGNQIPETTGKEEIYFKIDILDLQKYWETHEPPLER